MFQDVIKDVLAEEEQQLIEKGKVEGKVEGEANMLVDNVQNSMKNWHCSLEEACKILGHTVEEYNKALELLKAEKQ